MSPLIALTNSNIYQFGLGAYNERKIFIADAKPSKM
jgi:hypothetical protein